MPTIFIPVGGAAANAARGGQGVRGAMVAGGVTGAATGGLSGAGHDEGGVLDRLDGAALGTVTGGLSGAVLSGAGVLIARGVSRTRIWARLRPRAAPQRKPFHRQDLDDKWYRSDNGELDWPSNNGFSEQPVDEVLRPGTKIDRYSGLTGADDTGNFLSPQGSSFESRSLPYDPTKQQYAVYEVVEPLTVKPGNAAAHFDQIGGATQYMTDQSVGELVEKGVLRQIK